MKKTFIFTLILVLCVSILFAQEPYRVLNSFNSGELSPLLAAREDLAKYHSGCSVMENMIPLPQGGAQKRPGTKFVAESKNNTKIRLFPFQFSTTQSFVIEGGNQYARFFTNNAPVTTGGGTEVDATYASAGTVVSHWKMNDNTSNTVVVDTEGSHNFVASANTSVLHTDGKVGTGSFNLDGQYALARSADHADFTFIEGTNGDFSIAGWVNITTTGAEQVIMSKWDKTTGSGAREWKLLLDSSRKLKMAIADESLLLDSDLVAHWKLNDSAQDSVVTDETGNHNGVMDDEGNNYTSDHSVAGKINNAIEFDGTNDKIDVADATNLSFGDASDDSAFSISAWIYMDDATNFPILGKMEGSKDEYFFWVNGTDKLTFTLFDENNVNYIGRTYNGTALTANQGSWIHVVATYDATEAASGITIYLNGTAVDDANNNRGAYTAMHNNTAEVNIGYTRNEEDASNVYFADGKIDNTMIFDKELSQAEVTALYNGNSGTESLDTQYISTITNVALDTGWRYIAMTYEGENGSWTAGTAANYIILYVDSTAVAVTATNLATYLKMEDTAGIPRVGAQESSAGVIEKIWGDKIDNLAIFSDTMSAVDVASLYTAGATYEITTPYLTADLFQLKFEQSADILYITHPDYETRKLSRLSNDDWLLTVFDAQTGPFRIQNDTVTKKIAASATTGSVTLTATGHSPFVSGTTAGHLPSGTATTSKSQTGALFKLIHPMDTLEFSDTLEDDYTANQTEGVSWMHCGTLFKGAGWKLTTDGTWLGTVEVQRNYTIGAAHGASGWETVYQFSGVTTARNTATATRTEDDGDADYRVIFTDDTSGTILAYFETDQTQIIGIVEITAVASSTSATGTVIQTLGSTDATHKWAEGSWSNYRGWPQTVAFFEDRLIFGGNTSQPDTIWGSVTSKYDNMLAGPDDDDAVIFTLTSRQVNAIEWIVGKDKILIGTSGAEWTLSGSSDEPLTPSNVKAEQHSTYGSASLQATLANESVLFFQRGAERMRELAYNWELDSYVAPDMTILAKEVTGDGITETAFQQIPDAILWCIKENGDIATFSYERQENITSWSRQITDGDFESVAVIHGSAEEEVWVSVKRTFTGVNSGNPVRYIEYFAPRDFGSDLDDAYYVDSGLTDTGATTTISNLDHLEGEEAVVLVDGVVLAEGVGDYTVTSGDITLALAGTTVQAGLPYTVQMRTMPLSWLQGTTIHGRMKRISEVISSWYNSGDFSVGRDASTLQTYSISGMTTNSERITFPAGWDREGYAFIYQLSPEPLTIIALALEFEVN